jgi:hypothetical protein
MDQPTPPDTLAPTLNLSDLWGFNLEIAACEQCNWSYLLVQGSLPHHCPRCFQASLKPLENQAERLPWTHPPERFLPFTVSREQLRHSIEDFAGGFWFAPDDLQASNLQARLQRIYLPLWLVDSEVQAIWQAEVGFDYQVASHQDYYDENRNGWLSREITETRIRWDPRLGRLTRTYHNIAAPALEEHAALRQQLGTYEFDTAQPYRSSDMADLLIRLPNRDPADAWPEAIPVLRAVAAEECRRACRADHIRQFRWTAEYPGRNWSLLLVPMYTTYYLDDDKNPQPVIIHGQSGQLHGPRRASMRRAQRTAVILVVVAVAIAILSLVAAAVALVLPPFLLIAGIGLLIAFLAGLAALIPLGIAWHFNRQQHQNEAEV